MIIHPDSLKVSHAGKGHVRSRSECFLSMTLFSYSDESTPSVRLNISARSYGYEHSLDKSLNYAVLVGGSNGDLGIS